MIAQMTKLGLRTVLMATGLSMVNAEPLPEFDLSRQTPVGADQVIPITDFFRADYMLSPRINSAGTHIAATVTGDRDTTHLMLIDLAKGERSVIGGDEDRMIYSVRWLDEEHISFRLSRDRRVDLALMVTTIEDFEDPYPINQLGFAAIAGVPHDEPLKPFVNIRGWEDRLNGIFQLDADLRYGSLIIPGRRMNQRIRERINDSNQRHIIRRIPDPPGGDEVRFSSDLWGELSSAVTVRNGVYRLQLWNGERWSESPVDMDTVRILGDGDSAHEVIAQRQTFDGELSDVRFLDLRTGEWGETVLSIPGYEFSGNFYREPSTRQLMGARYHTTGPAVIWFDPGYASLQEQLDGLFPGRKPLIIGSDHQNERLVVSVNGDRYPTEYYLLDVTKPSLDLIARSRPWLDPDRMLPTQIFQYKTREGAEIDAYVTLPNGASKANPPPLVVMPSANMTSRRSWDFSYEAQFWASRGYAVLRPNHRASAGYRWKFAENDRVAFRKIAEDIGRATRALVNSGFVDPKRVAIMGRSSGAYLGLLGAVYEPDLYHCVLLFGGTYDLELDFNAVRARGEWEEVGVIRRLMGRPSDHPEKFAELSPLRHVDKIKAAVFVAHGAGDRSDSDRQPAALIRELKKQGITHDSWAMPEIGNTTREIENRVELITRMQAFLNEHL